MKLENNVMVDVLVKRQLMEAHTVEQITASAQASGGCLDDWRVRWVSSYLSLDGQSLLCHFEAVDTESVRMALRQTGWTGELFACPVSIHEKSDVLKHRVVVERKFDESTTIEEIQAIEDAGDECLNRYNVSFVITYFSLDKKTMYCLYDAPDAESVRMAQREAKMPVERVWACQHIKA